MNEIPDDELLSAYLDDELSSEQRAHVERLLAERPEYRRLYDELRGLRESLQALPSYRLTDDFGNGVLRRAEREMLRGEPVEPRRDAAPPATDGEPRWRRPLIWSIVAVAAAVAIMFVDRPEAGPEAARNVALRPERNEPQKPPVGAVMQAAPRHNETVAQDGAAATLVKPLSKSAANSGSTNLAGSAGGDAPAPPANDFAVMNSGTSAAPKRSLLSNVGPTSPSVDLKTVEEAAMGTAKVDITSVLAAEDNKRACALISELGPKIHQDVDKNSAESSADRRSELSLGLRVQIAPQYRATDPVLIMSCQTTAEGLERGLPSALAGQQIVDLTGPSQPENEQIVDANRKALQSANPFGGLTESDDEAHDVYFYVVANTKQIESAVDAIRSQSQYFSDVAVATPEELAAGQHEEPPAAAPAQELGRGLQRESGSAEFGYTSGTAPDQGRMFPLSRGQRITQTDIDRAERLNVAAPASSVSSVPAPSAKPAEELRQKRAVDGPAAVASHAPAVSQPPTPAAATVSTKPAYGPQAKTAAKADAPQVAAGGEAGKREEAGSVPPSIEQNLDSLRPELPPDYQEALFVFRVAKSTPSPSAAKPGEAPPALKSK